MIDKRLLSILVCPVSKAPVEYDKEKDELICRASGLAYPVRFGGRVEPPASAGKPPTWHHAVEVNAKAYDMVVPGHGTQRVSTFRL